jgi:3D (Asp-Asp-Asp) domain-containing protein
MDCGGAVNGNHIDVYFNSHEDALEFGVQYANVSIREEEANET